MFLSVFSLQGGQTPMHVATYYGNVTLVLILLQHGGSPDITNVVSLYVLQNKNSECFFCFFFLVMAMLFVVKASRIFYLGLNLVQYKIYCSIEQRNTWLHLQHYLITITFVH